MSISAGPWFPSVNYAIGSVVQYQGPIFVAAAVSLNVPPLPANASWTLVPSGGGGGGTQTLTQSGNTFTLSNAGGSVSVATTTQVAANTHNLTTINYNDVPIIPITEITGDLLVKSGGLSLDSVNDISTPGDVVSSLGDQDYSLNTIGAFIATNPVGYVGYGTFFYDTDVPPYGQGVWNFNGGDLNIQNDATQQTFLNALVQMIDTKGNASLTIWQSPSVYLATIATGYTLTSGVYHFTVPMAVGVLWTNAATTFYLYVTPTAGAEGPTGPQGPTGPAGPFSQALANKILVTETPDPSGGVVNLTWSAGDPANVYVPYGVGTTNTTLAPIDPDTTGTGWRFSKTYLAESVSLAGTTLVSGRTYFIVAVGVGVNWVAMGAAAATAGTAFLYNGTAPTGTGGTAYATTKISWYALNALYTPVTLPTSIVPSIAIKKKNLRNAWFLVKMNSDVSLQGSIAIQIETYAYQYGSNTSNDYTGRWAYSMPLQQNVGFNAAAGQDITTVAGRAFPRLRSGFTYLFYAGDMSPAYLPLPFNAGSYAQGGSALFAPSQVSTENTLRDPYELYTNYPHFGLTSTAYTPNAVQPTYGGSNPYTDQGDVEVASIYLNTDSKSPPVGIGQTVMDFNVMAFGYSGLVEGGGEQTFSYTTEWV